MKKLNLILLLLTVSIGYVFAQNAPYTVYLEKVNANLPGIHSCAIAQYQNYWLIIGGRTNGMHGLSSNDGFPIEYANNEIIVIDTVGWNYYSKSLNTLPDSVAASFRCTNMQFIQEDSLLYLAGGFGFDSTVYDYITFPTLTKFNIPNTIQSVINNTPIAPCFVQIKSDFFAACGGELQKQNNSYFLCFGHNFTGRYAKFTSPLFVQVYSNSIKSFQIIKSGNNISFNSGTVLTDTLNYHRRDLNVSEFILPDESSCLMTFGGVFQYGHNFPYLNPVQINTSGALSAGILNYQQTYSHYTCANFGIHDSVSHSSTQIFLGGISLNDYDLNNHIPTEDTLVPFINKINELTMDGSGNISEKINDFQMPAFLGANAAFLMNRNLNAVYNDKIINAGSFSSNYILAGYMFGGIKAGGANYIPGVVNNDVYRVYVKSNITGIKNSNSNYETVIAPNPSSGSFRITTSNTLFGQNINCIITSVEGKNLFTKNFVSGLSPQEININLSAGTYFVTMCNKDKSFCKTQKLIIQ